MLLQFLSRVCLRFCAEMNFVNGRSECMIDKDVMLNLNTDGGKPTVLTWTGTAWTTGFNEYLMEWTRPLQQQFLVQMAEKPLLLSLIMHGIQPRPKSPHFRKHLLSMAGLVQRAVRGFKSFEALTALLLTKSPYLH